jgi:O-antigen/teichoic acid export membrane protein
MIITGGLSVLVGGILPFILLSVGHLEPRAMYTLVGLNIFLTVAQSWNELTNGVLMVAQKSHILTLANTAYGLLKIGSLFLVIGTGSVGLMAAYAVPAVIVLAINFSYVPRLWPRTIEGAPDASLRALAGLSAGNWISSLAYYLPVRLGPALMLLFLPPAQVAYLFFALLLAEVLNYMSEAFSKSLFAHGSRRGHLTRSITTEMRGLLAIILIPAVAIGIVFAPFALSIFGGPDYASHFLALQLFLLATIPKGYYQILKAQFNVEQRPMALVASGSVLAISTLGFLLIGLLLQVNPDLLPIAWILGGLLGLSVGQSLAGRRRLVLGPAVNGR